MIISPVLQIWKLRPKEVNEIRTQGHTARQQQGPESPAPPRALQRCHYVIIEGQGQGRRSEAEGRGIQPAQTSDPERLGLRATSAVAPEQVV